jgi:DNA replicative helicase MCM subunit Mcm2 (Cdc46/Mcm family)
MIRLPEALVRLNCDQEIQPSYVREAFRLLKTSIIQVETSDFDVGDDEDREDGAVEETDDSPNDDDDKGEEGTLSQEVETGDASCPSWRVRQRSGSKQSSARKAC